MNDISLKNSMDMLYLLSCVVNRKALSQEKFMQIDLKSIFEQSCFHSVSSAVYTAIEPFADKENPLIKKWKENRNKAIRKEMLMDAERLQVNSFMEENNIWHADLKGIILKKMYPGVGIREMADNDILYDEKYKKEVRDYFVGRNYNVEHYGTGHDDVYHKEPVYNFEMTRYFFEPTLNEKFYNYYSDIKNKLLPIENTKCGFRLSDEDFYIYFIAHAYKHFSHGGTGVRTLMDCYVYLKEKQNSLDWDYIISELSELEILPFEKNLREISQKVFSDKLDFAVEKLRTEEVDFLSTMVSVGTYGTFQHHIENDLQKIKDENDCDINKAKRRYILGRIFPKMDYYKTYYPFFYKYKIFIPFFVIYRIFRGLFKRFKNIIGELKMVKKYEK